MPDDYATYPSLRGKRVLVTGGASGIGRSIVLAFARQGSRIVFLDQDIEAGERLATEIGARDVFGYCDVADSAALRDAVEQAALTLSGIDILITNAGDDTRHNARTLTQEAWDECLAVNLGHHFFAAQAAEPHLRRRGGSIVCLGSIAWLNGTTGMVAYTAAKAGIHGLVRTLARLWGHERIRVNALVPGWTITEKQLERWVDEDAERLIEASQCLAGRVEPEDVARAALFLASDDARMITHQTMIVDGGWV